MSPERANLVLSSDVPNCERDVFVLNSLDVESCRGTNDIEINDALCETATFVSNALAIRYG